MTTLLLDTDLDSRQREYANVIRASADALLVVINDLLDYSKIEAGKLELERIEMDLRAHVEEVATTQAAAAAAKKLELVVDVAADLPTRVLGDPGRIRQALANLVSNAIKFTAAGEVSIRVAPRARAGEGPRALLGARHGHRAVARCSRRSCSGPSRRPTPPLRASTAAPASGSRSSSASPS